MATSFKISIDDAAVQRAFDRLIRAGTDLTPAMDDIGRSLVASTEIRFERGHGPDGAAWTPSYRASSEGGKTLVKEHHLKDSITHDPSRDEVRVGTNVLYAAVHQFGATIRAKTSRGLRFRSGGNWVTKKQVTIPARPFLGVSRDDQAEIGHILADHIREAFQ